MAERGEAEPGEEAEAAAEVGAAAMAAALDEARADPALRPEVTAFFAAQRRLIDAQLHHMQVQLRHLGLKIVGERLRLLLQGLTVVGAAGLIFVLGAIVRDAMDDHGLVIESFAASPALAARGLTGPVLAEQMFGRLDEIRRTANANSITVSDDVRAGMGESVKVEIPETGLSLDQVQRFLHQTLGHARRLTGAVTDDGQGHATVEVQLSGGDPVSVQGASADLDKLMQQAAEKAFGVFDPVNYVLYLRGVGRADEALAAAERNFDLATIPLDVSNGLSLWANSDGDRRRALLRATLATEVYPKGWAGWSERAVASLDLGRNEAALAAYRRMLATRAQDQWRNHRPSLPYLMQRARAGIDRLLGDDRNLEVDTANTPPSHLVPQAYQYLSRADMPLGEHDCGGAARRIDLARAIGPLSPASDAGARSQLAACRGDWPAALSAAQARVAAGEADLVSPQAAIVKHTEQTLLTADRPELAQALAMNGRIADAEALIGQSPTDCYLCLRVRGQIAVAKGDAQAADRWFAEALRQAPSPPFAYVEWARAKLDRGDAAGALAELRVAAVKSPDFPDTPELWGEALMRQGDPADALAYFARANELAPRWGRLHLLWGEALSRLGRRDDARSQFGLAAGFDLSAADRADLARISR